MAVPASGRASERDVIVPGRSRVDVVNPAVRRRRGPRRTNREGLRRRSVRGGYEAAALLADARLAAELAHAAPEVLAQGVLRLLADARPAQVQEVQRPQRRRPRQGGRAGVADVLAAQVEAAQTR